MERVSSRLRTGGSSRPWVVRHGIVAGLLLALPAFSHVSAVPVARAQTGVSLARGWQHVLMRAPSLPAFGLVRVVAGGPGVVATGLPSYHFWASADGRVWRLLPSPAFRRGEIPLGFYAAGRLFVIDGHAGFEPRIWASRDGGATWHESPAHFRITALAAGGDGAVAFSQADVSQPISVWTSADGLTWRQLRQQPGVFASAQVYSAARGVHGLVAGGSVGPPRQRAGIWTSPGGRTWRRVPNAGRIFGNGSDGSQVNYVMAGPRGILAIGQRLGTRAPVAWVSPDGVHWQRRTLPFGAGNVGFGQVVAWRGGFVAFTHEGGETAVWSSANGLTWTRVGSDELFGGSARVWSVTGFRGGMVAVGSFARHPRPACRGWLGDLQTFHPAAFLWSPAASASAPLPTIDRSDPRTLKLLPSDLGDLAEVVTAGSAYVDLCGADPALGPHRAYQLTFRDPGGGQFADTATSIVTASASASRAAFRHVVRLLLVDGTIQHQRELPARVRLGEGTRVFRLRIRTESEGADYTYTKFAVAWRAGRVIGVVVAYRRHEAVLLAKRQFAHLKRP